MEEMTNVPLCKQPARRVTVTDRCAGAEERAGQEAKRVQ